jgi:hypothetical protein
MNDKDICQINLVNIYNRNNFFTWLKNIDKLLILKNKSENRRLPFFFLFFLSCLNIDTSLIRAQEEFFFYKSPRS